MPIIISQRPSTVLPHMGCFIKSGIPIISINNNQKSVTVLPLSTYNYGTIFQNNQAWG